MIRTNNRAAIVGGLLAALIFIWSVRLLPVDYRSTWESTKGAVVGYASSSNGQQPLSSLGLLPHIEDYYEQAFSRSKPKRAEYTGIKEACELVKPGEWREDVYLNCIGIMAGMTSIMNQVKVCIKMAIDSGSNLMLPAIPLRDSEHLLEYNTKNQEAFMTLDQWFDGDHLRDVLGRACPRMKIIHPNQLESQIPLKNNWTIMNKQAQGYIGLGSFFWVGNPYNNFFDAQIKKLQNETPDNGKKGITLVQVDSKFVLYRVTDDPTGKWLHQWNDFSRLLRFQEKPREIANRLVQRLQEKGPYYGVHFRVENDTIWSSFDHQLEVDLDGLDAAWAKFGSPSAKKPIVYIACGDEGQAERFVSAGAERGWEVTHKWKLLKDDPDTTQLVNSLAFDFQGAVDLGIMVRAQFFFGITGSAFSSTLSNTRDPTGRYRGSSLMVPDDAGARSHLFFDGDAGGYPCCL